MFGVTEALIERMYRSNSVVLCCCCFSMVFPCYGFHGLQCDSYFSCIMRYLSCLWILFLDEWDIARQQLQSIHHKLLLEWTKLFAPASPKKKKYFNWKWHVSTNKFELTYQKVNNIWRHNRPNMARCTARAQRWITNTCREHFGSMN